MIIDGHAHIWKREMLPDKILAAYLEPLLVLDGMLDMTLDREQDWPMSQVDVPQLVASMDEAGIDKTVVLPLDLGMTFEARATVEEYNLWVFDSCDEYGDRVVPFIGVDPMRGQRALDLVQGFVRDFNAKGIKIYPAAGWRPDQPELRSFWRLVEELDLVVLTHAGASWGPLDESFNHPIFFRAVLERHPSIKIVIAHLGGKWRSETFELAKEFDNLFADCSALQGWLPSQPDVAKSRLREAAGLMPDRLIFGTDWPLFDLSYSHSNWVRFVRDEDWADADLKEKVLEGNIRRLLGI